VRISGVNFEVCRGEVGFMNGRNVCYLQSKERPLQNVFRLIVQVILESQRLSEPVVQPVVREDAAAARRFPRFARRSSTPCVGHKRGISMLLRLLAGLWIFGIASAASAGFIDGQKLREMLNAQTRIDRGDVRTTDYQDAARANGYVLGVVDMAMFILVCPGEGIRAGQLSAMVAKYLEDNPDKWAQSGDKIVIDALKPTFPCQHK
jgi:hypothetical protein